MPLEGSVEKIADLNPLWPLVGDGVNYGDDHLRNVKTAIQSLQDSTNGVQQLGFGTIEQTLESATTEITYTGLLQPGVVVVAILKQDATGGRQVTWDTDKFKFASPVEIAGDPGVYSIIPFVCGSDSLLWPMGQPLLGVTS